ncbi:MAG: preprotein translocase subunit SecG [Clostridiales bacterium]|nr:preprotein translocase subunit SecG [Clostridiales bacterium]
MAPWVSDSFPTVRLVLAILIVLLSLAITVLVLVQPGAEQQGMNAVTGGQSDTYYSKNKSEMRESMMKRLTIILGVALFVVVVLFFVTVVIYSGL